MNVFKEAVEQKQGQPWKVEKVCDDFQSADITRKKLLSGAKDGTQVKVKFLPSIDKFLVKSRKPEEIAVEQKSKKNKKQTPTA
jgi:hypothetical protein